MYALLDEKANPEAKCLRFTLLASQEIETLNSNLFQDVQVQA